MDGYGRKPEDLQPDQWGPLGFEILDADGSLVTDFRPLVKRGTTEIASAVMTVGNQYNVANAAGQVLSHTFECPESGEYRFLAKTIVLKTVEFVAGLRIDLYWNLSPADSLGISVGGAIEDRQDGSAPNNQWRSLDNEFFFRLTKGVTYTATPFFQPIVGQWQYWHGATFLQTSVSFG